MPRVLLLRRYSNGDAPLPEMSRNTKKSWEAFQKRARTNLGGLACATIAGRMVPLGVNVGTSNTGPGVEAARKVWRDNRLGIVFADAIWNMLSVRTGYLITGMGAGGPIITSEVPEQVITAPDPAQPWRARAALKAWRDPDDGNDHALVWVPGVRQAYVRTSKTTGGTPRPTVEGDWAADGDPEEYVGAVPVYALDNFNNEAEFEPHIDVIDRINLGKLQRLVTTAMQAFKARAFKGLDSKDEEGNDIDWAERLNFAPGAIVDLPEGIDIWESDAVLIDPLLNGEKADLRDFAAVMQLSLDVFVPDNQSGTGAQNAPKGEIQKAKDRIMRAGASMEGALLSALRILELDDGSTVEVLWEQPEHISLTEKTQAASQAKTAGLSQAWVNQNIMGLSPDEIQREASEKAGESLMQAAFAVPQQVSANA
jgi:hypothetical protein